MRVSQPIDFDPPAARMDGRGVVRLPRRNAIQVRLEASLGRIGLVISLALLMGNTTCPLDQQPAAPTKNDSQALDIGGPSGALWSVRADRTLLITLRTEDGLVASTQVEASSGVAKLLGRTIDIADFCWRMDAVCPHQVLPDQLALLQPAGDSRLFASFAMRGPLAELRDRNALAGQLTGNDLVIPLAVGAATTGTCGLLPNSGVLASAFAPSGIASERASTMQGRVKVAFDGLCLAVGGNGDLLSGDYVELSVAFSATRN